MNMYLKVVLFFLVCNLSSLEHFAQSSQLWYSKPANTWTEALPLGNGRLGAMMYGGVVQDHIQFNEENLWTGSPRSYSRPGASLYLDTLRQLLFEGKQPAAESIAEQHFMGLKSSEGAKEDWTSRMIAGEGLKGEPQREDFDDRNWKTMWVPSYEGWEAVGFDGMDGAVWLRTSFEMTKAMLGKDLVLDLNRIRDYDITYVNGHQVGSMATQDPRKYLVPAGLLHEGKNILAIQVLNFTDKGGIGGYKDTTKLIGLYEGKHSEPLISLKGMWRYLVQHYEPPAPSKYQADYQPFGDVWIQYPEVGEVSNYKRSLDLNTATHTVAYDQNHIHFQRTSYISQPHQLLVYKVQSSQKKSISFQVHLTSKHQGYQVKKLDDQTISLQVKVRHGALRGVSYVWVKTKGGQVRVDSGTIKVLNADAVSLYLSAATNYINYANVSGKPEEICHKVWKQALSVSDSEMYRLHLKEYQKYYHTFSIELNKGVGTDLPTDIRIAQFAKNPDPSFAALYVQYGRYLLIASSRPGTRPANLQGIWNELMTPPWGSKYTTNINLEMNYWPAELLNLPSMHIPLFDMIQELSISGAQTAKDHYNAPGWVLHHNTDLWRGTAPINASNHGIWVAGSGWLSHHLWEHFLFTKDQTFLRNKAYPLMRGAAEFYSHYLVKDPKTGWLISGPSNSPEQGGLVMGPTMDHQIIRSLFHIMIQADSILQLQDPFILKLKEQVKQIAPDQIGRHEQLQEWMNDVDDVNNKHRHISHLWGMYPGAEINWDAQPKLMMAARQSLLYRGDEATGWSLGWKINCWARFKEGDHALELIKLLISPAGTKAGSYPNLFDAHPPFQIDGNFGGAAGIGEMLVQSHTSFIDILPCLPNSWTKGSVKGICVRGGYELDIDWNQGQLTSGTLLAKASGKVSLRYQGRVLQFYAEKGKRYPLPAQWFPSSSNNN